MKLRRLKSAWNNCMYEIEEAIFYENCKKERLEIWAYLYIDENDGNPDDILLESVALAKQQAFTQFKVPLESWIELEPVEEEVALS